MSNKSKSSVKVMQTVTPITKEELTTGASTSSTIVPASAGSVQIKITSSAFDALGGEVYSGLNILKLAEGEAAGPFRFIKTVQQTMPAKKNKPAEDVTCYVGEHISFPGREIRLPIATAFTKKCEDAGLKPGDVIAVRRAGDYIDKTWKQVCQGFDLRVLARVGQTENLAKLAEAYPVQN